MRAGNPLIPAAAAAVIFYIPRYNLLPAGTMCYSSTPCYSGASCDGTSPACPSGTFEPEGAACMSQPVQNNTITMTSSGGNIGDGTNAQWRNTNAARQSQGGLKPPLKIHCRLKGKLSTSGTASDPGAVQQYLTNLQQQQQQTEVPECASETNAAAAAAYRRQQRQQATAAAAAGAQKSAATFRSRQRYWPPPSYSGYSLPSGQPLYSCGRCHAGHCMEVGQWRCVDTGG